MNGIGVQARAKKAGTEDAHWVPRFSYIIVVKRGLWYMMLA